MLVENNKAVVRRYAEAFNERDFAMLDELIAPDFAHAPAGLSGPDFVRTQWNRCFTAYPDLRGNVEEVLAEGDKVAFRTVWKGTSQGEWLDPVFGPIPPDGQPVSVATTMIVRVVRGKIVE